jgi:hypothetical protein
MKCYLAAVGAGARAGTAAIAAASVAAATNQQDGDDNPPAAVSTEETVIIAHTETSCEVVDRQASVSFHSMHKGGIGVQESRAVFTRDEAVADSAEVNTPSFKSLSRSVSLLPEYAASSV